LTPWQCAAPIVRNTNMLTEQVKLHGHLCRHAGAYQCSHLVCCKGFAATAVTTASAPDNFLHHCC
jgi:hypothetical protein